MRVFTGNGEGGSVSLRMNLERYQVITNSNHQWYIFTSQGPNGSIIKVVDYIKIREGIYNLAFGDWDAVRGRIDDLAESNNNDRDKILATVAATVVDFLNNRPTATVVAEGSTPARTRLYQMKIAQYIKEINRLFEIKGLYLNRWEQFASGRNYRKFRLKLKTYN